MLLRTFCQECLFMTPRYEGQELFETEKWIWLIFQRWMTKNGHPIRITQRGEFQEKLTQEIAAMGHKEVFLDFKAKRLNYQGPIFFGIRANERGHSIGLMKGRIFADSDLPKKAVKAYLRTYFVFEKDYRQDAKIVMNHYQIFCEETGNIPMTRKEFMLSLREYIPQTSILQDQLSHCRLYVAGLKSRKNDRSRPPLSMQKISDASPK